MKRLSRSLDRLDPRREQSNVKCVFNQTFPYDLGSTHSMDSNIGNLLSDPSVQYLFRIFLLLSKKEKDGRNISSQKISKEEVRLLAELTHQKFGYCNVYHKTELDHCKTTLEDVEPRLTFRRFLELFSTVFTIDRSAFDEVVFAIYDELVNQVFHKGFLERKFRKTTGTWRLFWCTVLPGKLVFYKDRHSTRPEDLLMLNPDVKVSDDEKPNHQHQFSVMCCGKRKQFATKSALEKSRWVWAINLAIARGTASTNFHRDQFLRREHKRASDSPQSGGIFEKKDNRVTELQETLDQAEERLRKKEAELNDERSTNNRLSQELETISQKLRAHVQAVKDEEIVRQMATRMLEEERERSEELEREVRLQENRLRFSKAENRILSQQLRTSMVFPDVESEETSDPDTPSDRHLVIDEMTDLTPTTDL